jgi:hypothetical protein
MICCLISNDVDDRDAGTLRIVKIGETVGESRPAVQQGRRWLSGESGITVRRSGRHAFEQPQDTAHPRDLIEGRDEMHLAGAGIGKAGVDSTREKSVYQAFGAVHGAFLRCFPVSRQF